jgi:bacterioferritin-associated ferredoxin
MLCGKCDRRLASFLQEKRTAAENNAIAVIAMRGVD